MEWTFKDRFTFRIVDSLEPWDIENKIRNLFREEFQGTDPRNLLSELERQKNEEFRNRIKGRFFLRLGVFESEKLIAWSFGWQDAENNFYMTNSAVLPEYRRHGIYSELVRSVLRITKEEGFQKVTSQHVAGNNPVIIAKLKAGFRIAGLEMVEWAGALVRLVYYHHETKNDLFDFRIGMKPATEQVSRFLSGSRV